ncbi:thioredoxin domain-containing protein [Candidatus Daviesbacteria bacterium]|nr:thioredoxin domain-containing protein [Candidatus Daviesbacteria bacterium]
MKFTGEAKFLIWIVLITLTIMAGAVFFLSKPEPVLDKSILIASDSIGKGPANAKVYLVEFSDFQCPACRMAKPYVDEVLRKYPSDVLFVYRHFPLMGHQYGFLSSQVSEAALKQSKFWEMYEYLFANQEKFSPQFFDDAAKNLGLDIEKFKKDLESAEVKDKVNRDYAAGQSLGVNSTPSFFLNGRKLNLRSFEDILREVEKEVGR